MKPNSFARAGLSALALSLVFSAAPPAYAGVSKDFRECDGLKKPKRSNDGMRGEASVPGYSGFSSKRGSAQRIIAACTAALESGKIRDEQTMRLAHVLRARAAAHLELGNTADAISDLDAADKAVAGYVGDFFYDRSMGVSLTLMRAIALHESGQSQEALALVASAAQIRPYSIQIQRAIAALQLRAEETSSDQEWLQGLLRIDPSARAQGLKKRPETIAQYAASAGEPRIDLPQLKQPRLEDFVAGLGGGNTSRTLPSWRRPVSEAMTTAYALTAVGDFEAADAWKATVSKALDEAMVGPARADEALLAQDGDDEAQDKEEVKQARREARNRVSDARLVQIIAEDAKNSVFEPMALLISTRKAVSEGRLEEAYALSQMMSLREGLITRELHEAYNSARGASGDETLPDLPKLAAARSASKSKLGALAKDLLIKPEEERKLINYKESRPNILAALLGAGVTMGFSLLQGVDKSDGFSSVQNADGTIKVEYVGSSTSGPVVQELTLLRCAEIVREQGMTHFVMEGRRDFQRFSSKSIDGWEMSRTLVGYKSELVIRPLGAQEADENALEAVKVIDDLGAIYYRDK